MSYEEAGTGYEGISASQQTQFLDRLSELSPLLIQRDTRVEEFPSLFPELPIGQSVIELTENEPEEGEAPVARLSVTNLGGMIEIGEGLTISSDPVRIETETEKAAFRIDGKTVVVEREKASEQNLRFEEDFTAAEYSCVRVIDKFDGADFSYWVEHLYAVDAEQPSYHEQIYRKPNVPGGEWEKLAPPSWEHILNGTKPSPEEQAALDDQSRENPNRFDQNRFNKVMELLAKVDISNRLEIIPSLGQISFNIVSGKKY